MLQLLLRRWFLLMLTTTLLAGMGWHRQFAPIVDSLPQDWIIGSVLLAMALPLRIDAMWASLRHPLPALLAVTINLVGVPLLAWSASWLLNEELALGIIITAAVPCTLASAAVWTRLAGGNDAVSLLVTMLTNLSCFAVTPALIYLLADHAVVAIPFGPMAGKLLLLIVLPIMAAQLLRTIPAVGKWATANKRGLGGYAQLGILSIVFVGAVRCGQRIDELDGQLTSVAGQIILMLVLVAAVHLTAWWLGFWTAARMGLAHAEQLAVAFAGSQKTLMVGLAIALPFGGLTVLPMLSYHVEQLLIDTMLAERLRQSSPDASVQTDYGLEERS